VIRVAIGSICVFVFLHTLYAQQEIWMHPNAGQWSENVLYRVDLTFGKMYIENEGFTYHFYQTPGHVHDAHDHADIHDHSHALEDDFAGNYHNHVVKSRFVGSSWPGKTEQSYQSTFYRNYFLGTNSTHWASNVHAYSVVRMVDFYPSIDLILDGHDGGFKYSFIVPPGVSPNGISWNIEGADDIKLDSEGNLIIETSMGKITESKPLAWSLVKGKKKKVNIHFLLHGNKVSFGFPDDFSAQDTLVIDPYIVFSSYSGSTTDNWGMTATPGVNGETYAAGIDFGTGYPTTTGAFDVSYNDDTPSGSLNGFDVTISKFNPSGTSLLFSTYLGGGKNELPESMIVSPTGELYVLGITASTNFPITSNAYQTNNAGGAQNTQISLAFAGTDLFISKFNETGTQLLASTYLGGSAIDGFNTTTLSYNYGDQFRSEIILHNQDVFIASHTRSSDFPVTNNSTLQGDQDAVVVRMNGNLSTLIWSSYYGGSGLETGHALAHSLDGNLFVAGGTSSSDFNFTGHTTSYSGDRDGYLLKLDPSNGSILAGTYVGGSGYDQCYFVQTDIENKVYIFGQTNSSNWVITPGKYGNPNSGQFIRKYDGNLQSIEWTTLIGAGTGAVEISPTAFLISDCFEILISGWGGAINKLSLPLNQATSSTTTGFPTTSGAYQTNTNGSSFYLALLSKNATNLSYGTFLGSLGATHNQHVDGGTSRFDKGGAVYHAVCASCGMGNTNGFMSTPGAWSETNPAQNCNLAAFKFQMGTEYNVSSSNYVCEGGTIMLQASGGVSYAWEPASSLNDPTSPNPIATPSQTTTYYVTISFEEGCDIVDSVVVDVVFVPQIGLQGTENICLYDSIEITATGGTNYTWSPNIEIDNINTSIVHVFPTESRYYYVTVGNECYQATDSIWIEVLPLPDIILANDTLLCPGNAAIVVPEGNMQPSWESHPTLVQNTDGSATVNPTEPIYYYVNGTDMNGCSNRDSILVDFFPIPSITLTNDTAICLGSSIELSIFGGQAYEWSPKTSLTGAFTANPVALPLIPTTYVVAVSYGENCILFDSVHVDLLYLPQVTIPEMVYACYGVPKTITVSGADTYVWSPSTYLNATNTPTVEMTVYEDIVYKITFTNICGSVERELPVFVVVPHVEAEQDTILCPGSSTELRAFGSFYYEWKPPDGLNTTTQATVIATPSQPTWYVVQGTDQYGCIDLDSVWVDLYPQPSIFISPKNQYLLEGDTAHLVATSSWAGAIYWSPNDFLNCFTCPQVIAYPPKDMQYTVFFEDGNGCKDSDDAWVWFDPLIYVPNTFTPDGDRINNVFAVTVGNIRDFTLRIFDRWGQLIFLTNDSTVGWDGTYKGEACQEGVYTWKIEYENLRKQREEHVGHVNLLR